MLNSPPVGPSSSLYFDLPNLLDLPNLDLDEDGEPFEISNSIDVAENTNLLQCPLNEERSVSSMSTHSSEFPLLSDLQPFEIQASVQLESQLQSKHHLKTDPVDRTRKKPRIYKNETTSSLIARKEFFSLLQKNEESFPTEESDPAEQLSSPEKSILLRCEELRKKILASKIKGLFRQKIANSIISFYSYKKIDKQINILEFSLNLYKYIENLQKIKSLFLAYAKKIRDQRSQPIIITQTSSNPLITSTHSAELRKLTHKIKKDIEPSLQKYRDQAAIIINEFKENQQYIRFDAKKRFYTILTGLKGRLDQLRDFNIDINMINENNLTEKCINHRRWALEIEKINSNWDEFLNKLQKLKPIFLTGKDLISKWEAKKEALHSAENMQFRQNTSLKTPKNISASLILHMERINKNLKKLKISISSHAAYTQKILNFAKENNSPYTVREFKTKEHIQLFIETRLEEIKRVLKLQATPHREMFFETMEDIEKILATYLSSAGPWTSETRVIAKLLELEHTCWERDGKTLTNLTDEFFFLVNLEFSPTKYCMSI